VENYVQVLEYLERYGPDYSKLFKHVKEAADAAHEDLGPTVIASVYGRPEGSMGPFKDPRKVAAKLRKSGNLSASAFLKLNDIIGLTVVIQYPDQRRAVLQAIRRGLTRHGVKMGSPETHENKKGYFGHHEICRKTYGTDTLKCEVQIKTLLHDAWAKKMHDLTYKPGGKLDRRLAALMEAGSVTIESLEQQSLLIRNLIQANWDVEKEARRLARESVFKEMLDYSGKLWEGTPAAARIQELHEEIEKATPWLAGVPADSDRLQRLMARIGDCCSDPQVVRFGWMLAGRLATLRPDWRIVRSCALITDEWLKVAPDLLESGVVEAREVLAVPLMFYAMNELELSIAYSDKILKDGRYDPVISDKDWAKLEFNRANFVVEREYHFPTDDGRERTRLRAEASAALTAEGLVDDETAAGVLDLEGMIHITFASTTEEVRKGIRKCIEAEKLSTEDEQGLSEAYANLNMRLGWRRYFELEVEEQRPPDPAR